MTEQAQLPLPDPDNIELHFAAMRASQPIGDLYVTVMDANDLCLISNFDVRRVLQEDRDVEKYLGIQRPLNPRRVVELEKYVQFADATFPTSIIIAIEDDYTSFDEELRHSYGA
jgi:DGQHR domain-containing protein